MSPAPNFDPQAIDTRGAKTLVLAQRTSTLKGHRVAMHTDVTSALRKTCDETLAEFGKRRPRRFQSDLDFNPQTQYLVVPLPELVAHRPAIRRGRPKSDESPRATVEVDAVALGILTNASSMPLLDAKELKAKSFLFYAVVVGNSPSNRIGFVSRWNPHRAALSGHLLTSFGDKLRKVEGPLLAFAQSFDMVVTPEAVAVLSAGAFEAVFRDIDAMQERIPVWSEAVAALLPVDDANAARIEAVCKRNSTVAKQARAIFERPGLKKFTSTELGRAMRDQGLDARRLIKNGQLVLDDADVTIVLKLVDEKLYTGWHTATRWDVGTRAQRD